MISYIQGTITSKSPAHVIIESGGLGYLLSPQLHPVEPKAFAEEAEERKDVQ
ncbi:MAG: hypothetical protein H0W62_02040 [Chitinophagales bacterium]|nr:hypothetical protein [Chitinophagales bacterium]